MDPQANEADSSLQGRRRGVLDTRLLILAIGMVGALVAGLLVGLGYIPLRTMFPLLAATGLFLPVIGAVFARWLKKRQRVLTNHDQGALSQADRTVAPRDSASLATGDGATGRAETAASANDQNRAPAQSTVGALVQFVTAGDITLQNTAGRAHDQAARELLAQAASTLALDLQAMSKAAMPLNWASAHRKRAATLLLLANRLSGAEQLRTLLDTVASFDAVLDVYSRVAMPLDWARTQTERAGALQVIGEMHKDEKSVSRLRDAVTAYDAALSVYTREAAPEQWARTQHNRASALQRLAESLDWCDGATPLNAAVAGYDAALEVLDAFGSRARRGEIVLIKNNRATALTSLATRLGRQDGQRVLLQAIDTYGAIIDMNDPDADPAGWALAKANRASTLVALVDSRLEADHERGFRLRDAINDYDAALEIYGFDRTTPVWIMTQTQRQAAAKKLDAALQALVVEAAQLRGEQQGMAAGSPGFAAIDPRWQVPNMARSENDQNPRAADPPAAAG